MKTICLILSCLLGFTAVKAQPLSRVAPEQVGMDSQRLLWADEAINKAIAEKEIPGAVLAVVRHGKMAYLKAYGNKSLVPKAEPMTTSTVFDMASCSKSMSTAVCTMMLVERGLIRLLDPVSLYIPDFRPWQSEDGKRTKAIRIQDLLTHTSGLPAYAPVAQIQQAAGSPCPDALMQYIDTCQRGFEPQTDFRYSCLNFVTLQRIIETVSGCPRTALRCTGHEAHRLPALQAGQERPLGEHQSATMATGRRLPHHCPHRTAARRASAPRTGTRPAGTHP